MPPLGGPKSICGGCVQALCPARAGGGSFSNAAAAARRGAPAGAAEWAGLRTLTPSRPHLWGARIGRFLGGGPRPQSGRSPAGRGRAHIACTGGVRAKADEPRRGAK